MKTQDALRALVNCGRDFRDARNHKGEYAFHLWGDISGKCNSVLRQLLDDGWLRSIPGMQTRVDGMLESMALCDRLIGFVDVEVGKLGALYFVPGLIYQDPIFICNPSEDEMLDADDAPSFGELWDQHGFMILGRYASGCDLIVEIVNREITSNRVGVEVVESKSVETSPTSDYGVLWDYANRMWARGTDKYKICESISNGPGNYSDCVDYLVPKCDDKSLKTKRFHAVKDVLNEDIRCGLRLEVYRDGQQVLIRKVGEQPTSQRKLKRTATKKKTNMKRKR